MLVLSCLKAISGSLLHLRVATVVGFGAAELPTLGKLELKVQLAVLVTLGRLDAGSGLSNKRIVQKRDSGQVARDGTGDATGIAAGTGVGYTLDCDTGRWSRAVAGGGP